jgi:mRNA interferase MazF
VTFNPGDVVTVDFPGVTGIKRRPAVVLSLSTYHANRPDVIVGHDPEPTHKAIGKIDRC